MNINLTKIKVHDDTVSYKHHSYEFCCKKMKEVLESDEEDRYIIFTNEDIITNKDREYEYPSICISILGVDEFGENFRNNYPIKYCPFCGKRIKITTVKEEDWTKEYESLNKYLNDLVKAKQKINTTTYAEYNKILAKIHKNNKIFNDFYYIGNYEEFCKNITNIIELEEKEENDRN